MRLFFYVSSCKRTCSDVKCRVIPADLVIHFISQTDLPGVIPADLVIYFISQTDLAKSYFCLGYYSFEKYNICNTAFQKKIIAYFKNEARPGVLQSRG